MKDWTGNSRSSHATLGARNYAQNEREANDYYATEPKALELLLDQLTLDENVWECACGKGHLCKVLEKRGYKVKATDLIDRGYGEGGVRLPRTKDAMVWRYYNESTVQICTAVYREGAVLDTRRKQSSNVS